MKKFSTLITERKGEKAHREAEAMGLKYKGFGYWVDPNSGEVTHKTEGDNLVAVDPDVETDKWGGDGPEEGGMPGMAGGGAPGGAPGGPEDKEKEAQQQALGQNVLGTAEPGMAQAPKRMTWEPGPDGDHCIDSEQPKEEVPIDTFVGKTNYDNWDAGPDGTNYSNLSLDNFKKIAEAFITEEEPPAPPGDQTMMRQAMGLKTRPKTNAPFGQTIKDAKGAVDQMKQDPAKHKALGNQIASMMKIRKDRGLEGESKSHLDAGKQNAMWRKLSKLPAAAKDAEAVKQMNSELSPMVSDPKFDLDQFSEDDFEEGGAFGQVHVGDDYVVKKGNIGPEEMRALHTMKDNPKFPTLINGRFDGPFKHKSSTENNAYGNDKEKREPGQSQYWDPDDATDFDDKYPTAPGTYAMSRAPGEPLEDATYDYDDEKSMKVMRNLMEARGELHNAGIAHNDMHPGNIFVDDDQNVSILDFGLAKADRLAALREGLGFGGNNVQREMLGGDFQFGASTESFDNDEVNGIMDGNRQGVREMIMERMGLEDEDDEDEYNNREYFLDDFMEGGIREESSKREELMESFPGLRDDDLLKKLTERLYQGFGKRGIEQRMSDGFDKNIMSPKDQGVFRAAQKLRKANGEKPIVGKHFDFDD